ncbi:hypothetical protein [Paraburkholderia fungorum]|nr:hypothetical protein [Paraburkholderia fungorum]
MLILRMRRASADARLHAYDRQQQPTPAARSAASSIPRPAQQVASTPSTTTAGTDRMPSEVG